MNNIDPYCTKEKMFNSFDNESYGRVIYSVADDGESFWFSYWPEQLIDDIVFQLYHGSV